MSLNVQSISEINVNRSREPLFEDEPITLGGMLRRAAKEHNRPDMLSYKRDGEWKKIPSGEFISRARHIALGLYSLGIRHGDRIAIFSDNCPEWTLTDAGCQFGGVIDVPIYSTLTGPQVAYILKDSGAKALFVADAEKCATVRESLEGCSELEFVIFFKGQSGAGNNELTLAQLEERGRLLESEQPALAEELQRVIKPDDLATIIYTSGTTGEPKGVMLTHSNLVTNVIDSACHLSFGSTDTVLSLLPLSHVFERLAMYMYLNTGMAVYFAESLEKVGENIREVRPTIVVGVPRLFEKMYARIKDKASKSGRAKAALFSWAVGVAKQYAQKQVGGETISGPLGIKYMIANALVFKKWREGLGGRIRIFVAGGAALPEELGWIFQGAGTPIVQGYGLTETSPVIAAGSLENNRIGMVGKPIRNVKVRIAEDGEIEVQGPNVMLGYYKKPEATRAVFTDDGWFKTGDIGTLDERGYLKITDRKKELFKTSGGKYIAPQPIEQMIKGSRFVSQVVLIGNGRKFASCLIVPDWEQLKSYAALKGLKLSTPAEFVNNPRIIDLFQRQVESHTQGLAKYEKVKRIALLENELTMAGGELTPTLKVKRRVIDEKYKPLIDRIYAEAEEEH